MSASPYRLSDKVIPMHYWLDLQTDFEKFTFVGREVIAIRLLEPTDTIILNSAEIEVAGSPFAKGILPDSDPINVKTTTYDEKYETVTFGFETQLPAGIIHLYITYLGKISDKLNGFYRTWYMVNGEKHWGGATQFEATDARRAFPCFDEPALKATFEITISAPEHMTVLSNMPVESTVVDEIGKRKRVSFKTTQTMSTYLVAWVIAELEYMEGVANDSTPNATPIRVYTVPGKKEHGRFALDIAVKTLEYFENWFGIPYALPKLDMVAMPDFAAGAMENWGLVTYRETASLVNPDAPNTAVKQRVAEVVCHELAHQWFGNFTTMIWWTHLWLNEGFATFMGTKAVNHLFPEWDVLTGYIADDFVSALAEDSLVSTHAIEVEVVNPGEISEVFDSISYSKGCVVNFMLQTYLSEEVFRHGLNKYLTKYAYSNATTDDLWKILEEVSGKPVTEIMAKYTRQPGYPVIFVDKKDNMLMLRQQRFLADGGSDTENLQWDIPVGIEVQYGSDKEGFVMIQHYLDKPGSELTHPEIQNSKWIKLNPGQTGFYRVCYSPEMSAQLARAVRVGELSPIDRLCLLSDTLAMAKAGFIKTSQVLELLSAYKNEDNYYVLRVIAGVFSGLDNLLDGSPAHQGLKQMASEFFKPLADRAGWAEKLNESDTDILKRSLVLGTYGSFDGKDAIGEARRLFWRYRGTPELHTNIRGIVYNLIAQNGGKDEYEALLKLYRNTDIHEERVRILRALGRFQDTSILEGFLRFIMSKDEVRLQDTYIPMLSSASAGVASRKCVWEFFKENWEEFKKRYNTGGLMMIASFIEIPSGFTAREDLEDVRAFYKEHELESTKRTVKQVIETIENRVKWLERDKVDITLWFIDRENSTVISKCADDSCAIDPR